MSLHSTREKLFAHVSFHPFSHCYSGIVKKKSSPAVSTLGKKSVFPLLPAQTGMQVRNLHSSGFSLLLLSPAAAAAPLPARSPAAGFARLLLPLKLTDALRHRNQ